MLLIAGLGNPGEKYIRNRHNVGFMFVDFLVQWLHSPMVNNKTTEQFNHRFKFDKYSHAEVAKFVIQDTRYQIQDTLILVKPQTYMNRSGESIRQISTSYQLPATSLFIAHDDLDIDIGKYKIQLGVGPKKHNGLSSIENHIHTADFWRIRIGVDNRQGDRSMTGEDYVLQNFSADEENTLQQLFPEILSKLLLLLEENKK